MAIKRPLTGLRILVTRAKRQASDLSERLEALGAEAVVLPSIEVLPPEDELFVREALGRIGEFDWVVFTSTNGVKFTLEKLENTEALQQKKLAAVGPATARELAKALREPDLIPEQYVAESLSEAFGDVKGRRFLFLRGDLSRKDIVGDLRSRGAEVEDVVVYRTVAAPWPEVVPEPDILTFTSSSGVLNTHERLTERGLLRWFETKPIVSIGPITTQTIEELGYPVAATAEEHTIPGLVEAVVGWLGG